MCSRKIQDYPKDYTHYKLIATQKLRLIKVFPKIMK